ncbi:MAG TPA: glycoside hydrolase family 97 catalytic domain-containing protein [Candidatus Limnocylindria bacterium]|nr:glycoside hydrolase family 97 catalytic domain-containing protein [Candidatus Limnocylindria bacterium]
MKDGLNGALVIGGSVPICLWLFVPASVAFSIHGGGLSREYHRHLHVRQGVLSRHVRDITLLFFALLSGGIMSAAAPGDAPHAAWRVSSPDARNTIEIVLDAEGRPSFSVQHRGRWVLRSSPLGLAHEQENFEGGLGLQAAEAVTRQIETYELLSGNNRRVRSALNRRSIVFTNATGARLAVDLAASDQGVAFRYRLPDPNAAVQVIRSERTGFAFGTDARGWLQPYHAAGKFTPAYEDYYYAGSPRDVPHSLRAKAIGWAFPVLLHSPSARTWVLLSETGTDANYCATHLTTADAAGVLQIAFPSAEEGTSGIRSLYGPEPRWTTPWTMPWRVLVLGDTASEIPMASLVTDLAEPARVADTGWIHTGRSSWSWWSYPEGPNTPAIYDAFSDFAARMGWEYTLFDGGWWEAGLKAIESHARTRGLQSIAWSSASDFYAPDHRQRKLDEFVAGGVAGVKADFWCSDRQEAIAAMHGLLADAADRKLVIDLHGCTLPRGWQRTWPNLLTAEAVLGTESYFYEPSFPERAAELNTLLPFTRNAVAPMDYTPVALTLKRFPRKTTAAHELATAVVFTSGVVCFSDSPERFGSLPEEARRALRDMPATWDESRCLLAEPGEAVVFARRKGTSWFVAGLNGTSQARDIALDLRPFRGSDRATLLAEGTDPVTLIRSTTLERPRKWHHILPPRGGFILRLER